MKVPSTTAQKDSMVDKSVWLWACMKGSHFWESRSVLQWACGWAPGEHVYQVFVRNYLHVCMYVHVYVSIYAYVKHA